MLKAGPRELSLYVAVVAAAAANLAWSGYTYSLNFDKGGAWHGYAPGLQQGWLLGRSVDLSDIQWREFRAGLPALSAAFAIFVAASRLAQRVQQRRGKPAKGNRSEGGAQGNERGMASGGGGKGVSGASSVDAKIGAQVRGNTEKQRSFPGGNPYSDDAEGTFVGDMHGSRGGTPYSDDAKGTFVGDTCVGSSGSLRTVLYLVLSAAFLGYLHNACALFPVALATLNFMLAHRVAGRQHGAKFIWASNIAALLAARLWNGFSFGSISPALAALDSHRGSVRWEICFNLSLLRMLSFALDLHWRAQQAQQRRLRAQRTQQEGSMGSALGRGAQQEVKHAQQPQQQQQQQQKDQKESNGTAGFKHDHHHHSHRREQQQHLHHHQQQQQQQIEGMAFGSNTRQSASRAAARWRQATPLPSGHDYCLTAYLSYVFYPPLYLAGPIMTFQDFAWQMRQAVQLPKAEVLRYAARFAADLTCLEVLTHTLYYNSIAKHRVGLRYSMHGLQYGPMEAALTGFWALAFMWLKFATIWRFFRLVSLLDGVVPPENMKRCFANNYDVEGFWKGWHSSYNAWLVRYMYIPLGGSKRRLLNIWPIFLFVALWHDLEWRLLGWALLVCAAFTPELLVKHAAARPSLAVWRRSLSYRHTAAALATLNISGLMAANLAGFVLGPEGVAALAPTLLRQPGLMAAILAVFYSAAQVMFWLRAREAKGEGG